MIKVYGPYTRKDGRQHVILVHEDLSRQTMSYPKYLMEQHLKRALLASETVDHINNDFTDNRIENLGSYRNITNNHDVEQPIIFTFLLEYDDYPFLNFIPDKINTKLSSSEYLEDINNSFKNNFDY